MYENILVPFFFIFAIVFGSLRVANIFGKADKQGRSWEGAKKVDAVIALALSLFAISNASFVNFIWTNFGLITLFFIAMFFIIFIMEVFGLRDDRTNKADKLLTIGAIMFLMFSLSVVYGNVFSSLNFMGSSENAFLIIALVFIVVLFWLTMRVGRTHSHQ